METVQQIFAAIWTALLSFLVWLGLAAAPAPPAFQGYVEGEFVLVAPAVGGRLTELRVRRGDRVAAGDMLFTLESVEEAAMRNEAAAALEQAQNRLANLSKGKRAPEIDIIEAQKAQAEVELRLAWQQLERQRSLKDSSAFSQEKLDQARAEYDLHKARVQELTAQLTAASMTLGREDELRAAEAEVAARQAALEQAQWRLDQKSVYAPLLGLVTDTYFDPGETVTAGRPVISILPPDKMKVRFFVPQAMLADLPVGTGVTVRCDGCTSEIPANVVFVSPTAEYTPPVLYNRENRDRLMFMIEAYPLERHELLRPGQPVDVVLSPP